MWYMQGWNIQGIREKIWRINKGSMTNKEGTWRSKKREVDLLKMKGIWENAAPMIISYN